MLSIVLRHCLKDNVLPPGITESKYNDICFLGHYNSNNGSSGVELQINSSTIRHRRYFRPEIVTKFYVSFKEKSINTNLHAGLEVLTKMT